jgi:hypothetical protein
MPPSPSKAGEALSYVQGESPKDSAAVARRLSNSPVTSVLRVGGHLNKSRGAMMDTESPKKPKKRKELLENVLRQMHETFEMVFDYDHDSDFVPSADQLVLFEVLHKQVVGYDAMLLIICTMRERAKVSASAEIKARIKLPPSPLPREGGEEPGIATSIKD